MQEVAMFISHHALLSFSFVVVVFLLLFVELIRLRRKVNDLTPLEVTQLINHKRGLVVDIRSKESFQQGHIIDALLLSSREIRENFKKLDKYKERPIILVCDTGIESQKIAAILYKRGYDTYALSGGLRAWQQAEMPLIKEK
ncbi:MAG: hypothetical protein A3F12_06270 [Gammaproteobacteria bacterium RIFCSPHIGHO2_12_FULL_38_14]|nr:MAG: hypothetical protein A3F12_06270 [Gammaproteobacteria bacterium RIFCSPHIGHO2_12_FULL_38_14]